MIREMASWCLTNLPDSVKKIPREILPVWMKRKIGVALMSNGDADEVIETLQGYKFQNSEQRVFLAVKFEKTYEPELTAVVQKYLESDDRCIDVGANFGWYSVVMGAAASSGEVFSYEPTPETYILLEKNIGLNDLSDRVQIKRCCVSDTEESVNLVVKDISDGGLNHVSLTPSDTTIQIPTVVLDRERADDIGNISFIKIDVEGFEARVLSGCAEIMRAVDRPVIQIELNQESLSRVGESVQNVCEILRSNGYRFALPGANGICEDTVTPEKYINLFCVPSSGKYGKRFSKTCLQN